MNITAKTIYGITLSKEQAAAVGTWLATAAPYARESWARLRHAVTSGALRHEAIGVIVGRNDMNGGWAKACLSWEIQGKWSEVLEGWESLREHYEFPLPVELANRAAFWVGVSTY
jgi:hypothetical protein